MEAIAESPQTQLKTVEQRTVNPAEAPAGDRPPSGERKPGILPLPAQEAFRAAAQYTTLPAFVVHSSWAVGEIVKLCAAHGRVGPYRVRYDRDGRDTRQTFVVAEEKVYAALVEAGYDRKTFGRDFTIKRVFLTESNYPRPGRGYTIYIPIPENIEMTCREAKDAVEDKMKSFASFGIIPDKSWAVKAPYVSREGGGEDRPATELTGCFVEFAKDVPHENIALVKLISDDSYWNETKNVLRCFWSRERRGRKDKRGERAEAAPGRQGRRARRGKGKGGKQEEAKEEAVKHGEAGASAPGKRRARKPRGQAADEHWALPAVTVAIPENSENPPLRKK